MLKASAKTLNLIFIKVLLKEKENTWLIVCFSFIFKFWGSYC